MSKYIIINNGLVAGVRYTPADNTVFVEDDFELPETGTDFVNAYKEYLLNRVLLKYQGIVNAVRNKYSEYEIESFTDQRNEWKLYIADNNAKTPIVDAIANARGISRDDLFTKIGNNVTAIAATQGEQNSKEDAIKACTTIEELEAIEI